MIIVKFSHMKNGKVEPHIFSPQKEEDEAEFLETLMYDPSVVHVESVHYVPKDVPLIINGRRIWKNQLKK